MTWPRMGSSSALPKSRNPLNKISGFADNNEILPRQADHRVSTLQEPFGE